MGTELATVDGIPTFWTPVPGPFRVALLFRVGIADETLPTRGITHLVEHLALFASCSRSDEANGFVDAERCVFYAAGERDEAFDWLRRCAAALADLPLDRLATERRILRAEEAGANRSGVQTRLLDMRFGADGYGLVNYRELGLRWLGEEQVADWARTRFTRGNAVLWMTGEPPDALDLPLPEGERCPPPRVEPSPGTDGRRFLAEGGGGVAFAGLAKRSTPLNAAIAVAYERLYVRLRRELGLVYEPWAGYEVLGPDDVHVLMGAECADEKAAVVADEVWRIATAMAESGITREEIEQHRRRVRQMDDDPNAAVAELDHAASQTLLGADPVDREQVDRELADMGPDDVAAAVAAAFDHTLAIVPECVTSLKGFDGIEFRWPDPVEGSVYRDDPARGGCGAQLHIGDRGVTVTAPKSDAMTVEWESVVLLESAPVDTLRLNARDSSWIEVCLTPFREADQARAEILRHLPELPLIPAGTAEATEAVEALAEKMPDDHVLAHELAALPRQLGEDEMPEAVMAYRHGDKRGLLALTSDRLIRWYLGGAESDGEAIPREAIRRAHLRRRLLRPPVLVVEHERPLELTVDDATAAEALAERLTETSG